MYDEEVHKDSKSNKWLPKTSSSEPFVIGHIDFSLAAALRGKPQLFLWISWHLRNSTSIAKLVAMQNKAVNIVLGFSPGVPPFTLTMEHIVNTTLGCHM